jgi:hypothetical protein
MRDDLRRFVMLLMLGLTVLFTPWVLAQDDTAPPPAVPRRKRWRPNKCVR